MNILSVLAMARPSCGIRPRGFGNLRNPSALLSVSHTQRARLLRTTHVLLAPNDKEMRWRLRLVLVLLSVGLPMAASQAVVSGYEIRTSGFCTGTVTYIQTAAECESAASLLGLGDTTAHIHRRARGSPLLHKDAAPEHMDSTWHSSPMLPQNHAARIEDASVHHHYHHRRRRHRHCFPRRRHRHPRHPVTPPRAVALPP